MASVNKVILVGNLGRDPETRYAPEGGAITNISVATTETWKDKASGEKQERTEWHRVVFFNRLAEIAGEYLKKGSQVYVEGGLRPRKWQDKESPEGYTAESAAIKPTSPGIAENGAVVPVSVESALPKTQMIAILVEKNPNTLSADFEIPEGTDPFVTTRVKMAETSNIYALVKADGKYYH